MAKHTDPGKDTDDGGGSITEKTKAAEKIPRWHDWKSIDVKKVTTPTMTASTRRSTCTVPTSRSHSTRRLGRIHWPSPHPTVGSVRPPRRRM
jgi:hypothetical protein